MTRAAHSYVNIEELHRASGEYLARQLHCEGALVTAGAASALTLGTAACITRGNDQAILNLPVDMTGLKNEVVVQKSHRYDYDHALRNCGIKFVEVETLPEYDAAFNERTVMAHFFNAATAAARSAARIGCGSPISTVCPASTTRPRMSRPFPTCGTTRKWDLTW